MGERRALRAILEVGELHPRSASRRRRSCFGKLGDPAPGPPKPRATRASRAHPGAISTFKQIGFTP